MTHDDTFNDLVHPMEVVLDEDLAALQKMPVDTRIDRYNQLKQNEQEFVWEYAKDANLTTTERDKVRSKFRLARLLIAASLYDENELPPAMTGDFIEAELEAVIDFDRYRRFDVLSEDQIEEKIRRMEGEVYELVTEYTSTQIANMDDLMDNADVQQDVLRRLLDRYEDRREKIRQGFFVYVETHGLEHMVESIETAIKAVDESASERKAIRDSFQEELEALDTSVPDNLRTQTRTKEAALQALAQKLQASELEEGTLETALEDLETEELTAAQTEAVQELGQRIEHTTTLETRLEEKISELESVKQEARESARESAREETAAVVEEELQKLRDQRDELRTEIDRLKAERESLDAARDRLAEKQTTLESQVESVQESLPGGTSFEGTEDAISASTARLLELDYIGRVDSSINDLDELHVPDGVKEIPEGFWEGKSERRNERSRLTQLVDEDIESADMFPLNRRVRYEVTNSRYLGLSRSRELVIEAAVQANLEAFVQNGFDSRPADVDDLLAIVNEAVHEAEQEDYHYLLAVASPTGWSERVRNQLEDDDLARVQYSRHLSLVLVDLVTGDLFYDDSDAVAGNNSHLFEIPLTDELVEDCATVIKDRYAEDISTESILLEEVVEELDYETRVVKEAFTRLEQEGVGDQLQVEDYGLALAFNA